MNIEKQSKPKIFCQIATFAMATGLASVGTGCRGTAPTFSQAFSSLSAPARVPPPAQGSFQVPGSYTGGPGSPTNPASGGLGGSSFGNGMKTSQMAPQNGNVFNGIAQAQSQFLTATNNARNSVNRAADGIISSAEHVGARAELVGQGLTQAGAIITESATAPVVTASAERFNATYPADQPPPISSSSSGRIGDSDQSDGVSWRTPVRK